MSFQIKFSKVYYNNKTKQLRLVGKLTLPIPEVGLYLSETDTIVIRQALAFTTHDSANFSKDGYFDISLTVKPKQSLFFYHPAFLQDSLSFINYWMKGLIETIAATIEKLKVLIMEVTYFVFEHISYNKILPI